MWLSKNVHTPKTLLNKFKKNICILLCTVICFAIVFRFIEAILNLYNIYFFNEINYVSMTLCWLIAPICISFLFCILLHNGLKHMKYRSLCILVIILSIFLLSVLILFMYTLRSVYYEFIPFALICMLLLVYILCKTIRKHMKHQSLSILIIVQVISILLILIVSVYLLRIVCYGLWETVEYGYLTPSGTATLYNKNVNGLLTPEGKIHLINEYMYSKE